MSQDDPERRIFTYQEALEIFPQVRELTDSAVRQIDGVLARSQSRKELEERRGEIDALCQEIIETWTAQVTALGCEVKGLWLVDWDNGDGYYCWRYPEETLGHFHGYLEGFAGRVPIN